jgi:hypothetical protein
MCRLLLHQQLLPYSSLGKWSSHGYLMILQACALSSKSQRSLRRQTHGQHCTILPSFGRTVYQLHLHVTVRCAQTYVNKPLAFLHDSQFFRSPSLTTCSSRCIKDHWWACMQCQKVLGCWSVLTLQSTAGEIARNTSWHQYSHLVSMPLSSVIFKSKASCMYCTPKNDSCLSTFRIPRAMHNMECKRGMSRLSCHGCEGIRFSLEILGSCTADRLNCNSGDSIGPNYCSTLLCLPYIVDHRN